MTGYLLFELKSSIVSTVCGLSEAAHFACAGLMMALSRAFTVTESPPQQQKEKRKSLFLILKMKKRFYYSLPSGVVVVHVSSIKKGELITLKTVGSVITLLWPKGIRNHFVVR